MTDTMKGNPNLKLKERMILFSIPEVLTWETCLLLSKEDFAQSTHTSEDMLLLLRSSKVR